MLEAQSIVTPAALAKMCMSTGFMAALCEGVIAPYKEKVLDAIDSDEIIKARMIYDGAKMFSDTLQQAMQALADSENKPTETEPQYDGE